MFGFCQRRSRLQRTLSEWFSRLRWGTQLFRKSTPDKMAGQGKGRKKVTSFSHQISLTAPFLLTQSSPTTSLSTPHCLTASPPNCLTASLLPSPLLTSSLPHPLTASPPHCLTPSLPHPLTPSLPHCLTPSLPHCLTASLPHCLTPSLPHPLTASPPHCLTPSLPHPLTPSLPHSLTASLPHSPPRGTGQVTTSLFRSTPSSLSISPASRSTYHVPPAQQV